MKALEWLHTRAARTANYGLLLASMVLVVLGYPVLQDAGVESPKLLSLFFALVLLACLAAAVERTRVLVLFFGGVLLLEFVAGLLDLGGPGAQGTVQHVARGIVLFVTAGILLRDVLRARIVDVDTILGAICVYLLLGLACAEAYALLLAVDPGALRAAGEPLQAGPGARAGASGTTYFSFVTMTTLGYGDVTPASGTARALSTLQAVAGQFYIAVIVARLVALQVATATARAVDRVDAEA